MKHTRFKMVLEFDGEASPKDAMQWVEEEIAPLLPGSVSLELTFEPGIIAVEELNDYIGEFVTVNKDTKKQAVGIVDAYYRTENKAKSIVVLNGYAVEVGTYDLAYINEGGTYDPDEESESISGDGDDAEFGGESDLF